MTGCFPAEHIAHLIIIYILSAFWFIYIKELHDSHQLLMPIRVLAVVIHVVVATKSICFFFSSLKFLVLNAAA